MSYATTAPLKYDEAPGTEDILEDIKPPVKLSAVDKVFPDFFNIFPISDSKAERYNCPFFSQDQFDQNLDMITLTLLYLNLVNMLI